jgi:hypothetical protein
MFGYPPKRDEFLSLNTAYKIPFYSISLTRHSIAGLIDRQQSNQCLLENERSKFFNRLISNRPPAHKIFGPGLENRINEVSKSNEKQVV